MTVEYEKEEPPVQLTVKVPHDWVAKLDAIAERESKAQRTAFGRADILRSIVRSALREDEQERGLLAGSSMLTDKDKAKRNK